MSLITSLDTATVSPQLAANEDVVTGESDESRCITAKTRIYGSFLVADTEFALSVEGVQEVVNEPDSYSAVPLAPDFLLGLLVLEASLYL